MLSGSGRPGLRGSAASSCCARPSASAPAPPTLVCSRPRLCGSAGARRTLQRGGGTESPAGEGCTRPAQSGALGAGCPGQVGAAPGAREGAGPRQRAGGAEGQAAAAGAGRSRCSAVWPLDGEEVEPGSAFSPRGAVEVPASSRPCRVGLTGHRPQLHLRPELHFCGRCRGLRAGEEGGTPHLRWMKDSGRWVCMQSLPPPGRASLSIRGLVLSVLRKAKRLSPSRLNFLLFQEVQEFL